MLSARTALMKNEYYVEPQGSLHWRFNPGKMKPLLGQGSIWSSVLELVVGGGYPEGGRGQRRTVRS